MVIVMRILLQKGEYLLQVLINKNKINNKQNIKTKQIKNSPSRKILHLDHEYQKLTTHS